MWTSKPFATIIIEIGRWISAEQILLCKNKINEKKIVARMLASCTHNEFENQPRWITMLSV